MRTLLDRFDTRVTVATLRLPAWVRPIMIFATFVGGPVFTIGIGLLLVGIGLGGSNTPLLQSGIIVVLIVSVGAVLKLLLRRRRPLTYIVKWPSFATFSFPSGHTVGAVVAYGTLVYLSWQVAASWEYMGTLFLTLLAIIVSVSRVYLGAHYPSDVVGGWLLGGMGLVAILMIQPAL